LRRTPVRLLDRHGTHQDTVHTTPERMGDAFVTMLQAFVDCVIDNARPPVDTADARATLAVALAARQSLATGLPVDIQSQSQPSSRKTPAGPAEVRTESTKR
jgi:scyllo-inositol 2-dehydrogenase (NAD+)